MREAQSNITTHPGEGEPQRSDTAAGNKFNNQKENKMKVTFTIRHTEMVTLGRVTGLLQAVVY